MCLCLYQMSCELTMCLCLSQMSCELTMCLCLSQMSCELTMCLCLSQMSCELTMCLCLSQMSCELTMCLCLSQMSCELTMCLCLSQMSCVLTGEKESKELLLASMHQMDQLTQLVNNGLKLTPKAGRTEHGKIDCSAALLWLIILYLHVLSQLVTLVFRLLICLNTIHNNWIKIWANYERPTLLNSLCLRAQLHSCA